MLTSAMLGIRTHSHTGPIVKEYTMLAAVLLLAISPVLATAEQVPCISGEFQCRGYQSLSVVNNNHYCCGNGFNLQWKGQANNDKSLGNCVCDRQYVENDCLEGHAACQNATSFMSDGYTTKCCRNGYSMNSVSNSFINGVRVEYCKCTRYNNGGFSRPMTEAERAQFVQAMGQFSHQLQTGLNQMQQTLANTLGMFNMQFNNGFMGRLTDGLRRSLNSVANQIGTSALRTANVIQANSIRNIAQPVPPTSPVPSRTWDLRQRRFQQLQRRLQQRQQNGNGLAFWDRLSRGSGFSQMMNPGWWFGQNWRGIFGYRNQTALNSNINDTNDVLNQSPVQNTTFKL